jgi:hypothetical protein
METPKRTPEEILDAFAEQELAPPGASPSATPDSRVVAPAPRKAVGAVRHRTVAWIASGAVAVATTTALVLSLNALTVARSPTNQGPDIDAAPAPPTTIEHGRARRLRYEAGHACATARWAACEAKLDEARGLDPAGEGGERVKALREAIEAARDSGRGG